MSRVHRKLMIRADGFKKTREYNQMGALKSDTYELMDSQTREYKDVECTENRCVRDDECTKRTS